MLKHPAEEPLPMVEVGIVLGLSDPELLTEARVIGRLRGRGTHSPPGGPRHQDTLE